MFSFSIRIQNVYYAAQCCTMLYNVVLTFETVDEILKRDHSNESC